MADETRRRTPMPEPNDKSQPAQPDRAADVDPDVAQLLGLRPPDGDAIPDAGEIDTLGEMTDTRIYQGDLEARPPDSDQPDHDIAENLEMLTEAELREGETDDPNEAAEEGLTWAPPIDPPLRVGDEGPEVAAGFGTTAGEEPYDADHHGAALSAHDEVEFRVIEALRANATTAGVADRLELDVEGGVVRIAGTVDDILDEDAVVAVVERVDGVTRVDSRLVARAAEEPASDRR